MCQFSISSTCRALPVSGGAHVNYTTAWGFEVRAVFPVGTVAVVRAPGYPPDSKHVCLGTQWQQVPWRCEVMNGGCEHACNASTGACTCPAGQYLHYNNFTCTENPCASCRGHCVNNGGSWECLCKKGFKLGAGGRCVDVDECAEDRTLCSDPGQECVNLDGSYQCQCQDDYDLEDGVCVDVSICLRCEQNCEVLQGTAVCNCSKGFRVSPVNPTKCEQYCDEQDCPSKCERDQEQCYCPEGYIQDLRDEGVVCTDINECDVETQCQHHCENFFGGFRCLCEAGFQLQKNYLCVPKEDGSGLDRSGLPDSIRDAPHSGAILREDGQRPGHHGLRPTLRWSVLRPGPESGPTLQQGPALLPQTRHGHLHPAAGLHRDLQEAVLRQTVQDRKSQALTHCALWGALST